MSHESDARLSRLLRADAPAERDALFRISLIERRERQLYRRRMQVGVAVTAVLLVLPAAVLALGDPLAVAMVGGLGLAVLAAGAGSFRGVRHATRWLRGG